MGASELANTLSNAKEGDMARLASALNAFGEYQEKVELRKWISSLKAAANIEELRPLARKNPALLLPTQSEQLAELRLGILAPLLLSPIILFAAGGVVGYLVGLRLPANESNYFESLAWF